MVALVAGVVTFLCGLLLLLAPRLAWLVDRSFDLVDGSMSISATGTIGLNTATQNSLSRSEALDLGFLEMSLRTLLQPVAGMLTLSAVLILLGGMLMLSSARQLGAAFAILGVIPQLLVVVIGIIVSAVQSNNSPVTAGSGPTDSGLTDSGLAVGAGLIITVVTYVLVIACAIIAALRQGGYQPYTAKNPAGDGENPPS